MTDQQIELFPAPAQVAVHGPWVARCDDPGPYAVRRPTPKNIGRLEVLRCTSPKGHQGGLHYSAEPDGRVLAAWWTDGRPHWPQLIKRED